MASRIKPMSMSFLILLLNSDLLNLSLTASETPDPTPATWPLQFHSILFANNSGGNLQKVDLWYDWPNGRNFNIIQNQLGKLTYDLEWDNGTSHIYTLDSNQECRVLHFPVGILRPNWLEGATYLGQQEVDGFLCNVWEKVDFIWYYEDVITKRPVYWVFYTGLTAHVMTFEVGAVLDDAEWQAPDYCFKKALKDDTLLVGSIANGGLSNGRLLREMFNNFSVEL
ncbi:hypothetical protein Tsubulata_039294 [Turnera subulata]|uniref:Transferase, transferring glycosyl groups n=1 Tax=Turnera subulata TaxID=218843 RepID=A0A9Q0FVW1_9ROSI|nr:hypothetical protein Tsubulata_039294 [Turnera subulata]